MLEFKKIVQILYQLVEFIRVLLCGDPLTQDGHAFALIWSHGSLPPLARCGRWKAYQINRDLQVLIVAGSSLRKYGRIIHAAMTSDEAKTLARLLRLHLRAGRISSRC